MKILHKSLQKNKKKINIQPTILIQSINPFFDVTKNNLNKDNRETIIDEINNCNYSNLFLYVLSHSKLNKNRSKYNDSSTKNFYVAVLKNKESTKVFDRCCTNTKYPIISTTSFIKNLNKRYSAIDNNISKIHSKAHHLAIPLKTVLLNKNVKSFKGMNLKQSHSTTIAVSGIKYRTNNDHVHFKLPDINLLKTNYKENIPDSSKFQYFSQLIEQKLLEYRIKANVVRTISGPVVTRFELNLSAGLKSSKISSLARDLARSLSVSSVQVIELIPGTPYVGLEIPNKQRCTVYLRDIICSNKFKKMISPLALVFGRNISGNPIVKDLRSMPHLLVAGTTGSGKSIGINAMIISILYASSPEDVRFIMIDPKILELSIYSGIPHLLTKVITDTQDSESILEWCVQEMENRYKLMSILGVRNLESYNHNIEKISFDKMNKLNQFKKLLTNQNINNTYCISQLSKKLPYIVIIIDEFSDLMLTTTKKLEILIIRLTQKARAAGIHIILSTQRPSVDVITGVIKANIPARIAFTVSSKIDSRTILGQSGAESLLGMGDMLYLPPNSPDLIRIHGAYITDQEIQSVAQFWKSQTFKPKILYKM